MVAVPPASPAKPGVIGALVVAALALVLAYQLAHWTWVFITPEQSAAPAEEDSRVDLAVAARLFGASSGAPTAAVGGLRLKGVIAPTPGTDASAIFSNGKGRDLAVFVGREVQPGVKLVDVLPDHVIVLRDGVRSRIDLETRKVAAAAPQAAAKAGAFRLNVSRTGTNGFSLSRKELDNTLRDPNQLNYLGQIGVAPGGGVRMDAAPPGSLAQKLGLQPGDVIRRVNGQSVASAGDLARLYQQFATLSAIQAEVQRGSGTVQLTYAIQP